MLKDINQRSRPSVWIFAITISAILLAIVFNQVDWNLAFNILLKLSPTLLAISFLLFLIEGIFTTLRIHLLTPNHPKLLACFKMTAWYVVLLITLPARLGEIAAIALFRKYLNQTFSPSLMNILIQRLFDVIILSSFFVITALFLFEFANANYLILLAIIIIILVSIILIWFDYFLSFPIKFIVKNKTRKRKNLLRSTVRLLLQARIWHRHRLTPTITFKTIFLTAGKWTCNLGGFLFILMALQLHTTVPSSIALGAAYNFLAIIPIQTIGGFGISEAGLTSLFTMSGMNLTLAASAAILIRIFVIIIPFVFWILVMTTNKIFFHEK